MRNIALSRDKDAADKQVLDDIYSLIKAQIKYNAERGKTSGTVLIDIYKTDASSNLRHSSFVETYESYEWGTSLRMKPTVYEKNTGLLSKKRKYLFTQEGKIIADFISKKAKKDGLSLKFVVTYPLGENYEMGKEFKVNSDNDNVKISNFSVTWKL